jgi:hypothetical protein
MYIKYFIVGGTRTQSVHYKSSCENHGTLAKDKSVKILTPNVPMCG